ncbi:hypothetical protein DSLPV1_005 [Dishui lake phycodnavirus 1]|uniref:hypothetical protein n=1 Tax=Dishui lake phycodnavirus 1 TaxID=2079134 RepID=UPI000CD67F3F|nr:hypothetical protein C5Y57_gp005 [Dishui lake phycodnavirus 1]AUT18976.1 hypothetical protein DSLPV1_005 [Dishui lake phycodnavirus 1]
MVRALRRDRWRAGSLHLVDIFSHWKRRRSTVPVVATVVSEHLEGDTRRQPYGQCVLEELHDHETIGEIFPHTLLTSVSSKIFVSFM